MNAAEPLLAVTLRVTGVVQGVGYRPFVHRLAHELGITGWVRNDAGGVTIRAEGSPAPLARFQRALQEHGPSAAHVDGCTAIESPTPLAPKARHMDFLIEHSENDGPRSARISPDLATCADCLSELYDLADRRHRYPFINCTNCGPRFSIIEALPYDRLSTSMRAFRMCEACQREYDDPRDRRFHAQPNACPVCGPHLEYWAPNGDVLASSDQALNAASDAIRAGRIVAIKGLGGFHLVVDARNDDAVARLRRLKDREEKPFALMCANLAQANELCHAQAAAALLLSAQAPIVLLDRRRNPPQAVADAVAPGNPRLGLMLPYTPLHHLLLRSLGFPIVATSGNRADEPLRTDEREALIRLSGLADFFFVHNRPIARHMDDSIMTADGTLLRCARGFAPLQFALPIRTPALATGAQLKNTVAIACGEQVMLSQHIGDLETPEALRAFDAVGAALRRLYDVQPELIVCDGHPGYLSTQRAHAMGRRTLRVQHHHAHSLACLAENGIRGTALGIAWDGTGDGLDGTIWGGEFLRVSGTSRRYERLAHLRTFPLPGGEAAVREPRRSALGLLYVCLGDAVFEQSDPPPLRAFSPEELRLVRTMLDRRLNCPRTSSAGRLFDAVASLQGLRQIARYEGQAAMQLEFAARPDAVAPAPPFADPRHAYPFELQPRAGQPAVLDWAPLVRSLIAERRAEMPLATLAEGFQHTLVLMMEAVARLAGEEHVLLTGGCFQNQFLKRLACERLTQSGYRVATHRRVPPNDGGIAVGQLVAAQLDE